MAETSNHSGASSIRVSSTKAPMPPIEFQLAPFTPNWNRSSTKFLALSGDSKRALNAVLKSALALTVQSAPPRFPALQAALESAIPFQIDVSIIGDAEMQTLNLEHRGKNKPTDVLSFALFEGETMLFPGETPALGDLVISVETAARQARELGHDLPHEVAFLAIHGGLHLLGYDHIRSNDRRVMWKWQEQLFEEWKNK